MTSPTHYRETILGALATQLATIGTGAPDTWATDKSPTILRVEINPQSIPELPVIVLSGKQETYDLHANESTWSLYYRVMSVRLLYFVHAWTPDTTISGCLHDLELALSDPTLGGVVQDLVFKSNQPMYGEDGSPLNAVEAFIDIKYRTATNAPSAMR